MTIETKKDLFSHFTSIGIKTWSDFDSRYCELEDICRDNGFRVGSTMDEFENYIKEANTQPVEKPTTTKIESLNFKKEINAVVTMYCSISNGMVEISRSTLAKIEKILTGVLLTGNKLSITWAVIHYTEGQVIEFDGLTLEVAESYKSDNTDIGRGIVLSPQGWYTNYQKISPMSLL